VGHTTAENARRVAPWTVNAAHHAGHSARSTAARLIAVQRKAGNAAVARLLGAISSARPESLTERDIAGLDQGPTWDHHDTPQINGGMAGSRAPAAGSCSEVSPTTYVESSTIQRAPTVDSHPLLTQQYKAMLASQTFRFLDDEVTTKHGPIRLTLHPSETLYNENDHEIRTNPQPPADIRANLLFELHNAYNRDHILKSGQTHLDEDLTAPGLSEQHLEDYRVAAYALSMEWLEWISAVEVSARAEEIDNSLGGDGGSQVRLAFAKRFDAPNRKWFNFVDFLEEQRTTQHTQGYDPFAGNSDWKGDAILELACTRNAAALKVTQKEYLDFRDGMRGRTGKPVKDRTNNPFHGNDLVILAARQGTPSPVVRAADKPAESRVGGRSRPSENTTVKFREGSTRLGGEHAGQMANLGQRIAERMVLLGATGSGRVSVTLIGSGGRSWSLSGGNVDIGKRRADVVAGALRAQVALALSLVPDGNMRVTVNDLLIDTKSAGPGQFVDVRFSERERTAFDWLPESALQGI
jgi:hypothetical protein